MYTRTHSERYRGIVNKQEAIYLHVPRLKGYVGYDQIFLDLNERDD